MLNFDAVDWKADVYVNDIQIGSHTGGYTHFGFDVTPYLKSGANTLVVKVADATDNDFQPRGKQVMNPRGIWYTPVSGIWQSVWIEPVATAHVADYNVVSDIKSNSLDKASSDVPICKCPYHTFISIYNKLTIFFYYIGT